MYIQSERLAQIDILKGLAIIGVLILHSLPIKLKISSYAVFHIWQSVPILIVIFGLNSNGFIKRYSVERLKEFNWRSYLSNRSTRVLLPVIFIYLLSLTIGIGMIFFSKSTQLYFGPMLLLGQFPFRGPGNYFISVIIQLIFIAPIFLSFYKKNKELSLIGVFLMDLGFQLFFGCLSIEYDMMYEYICTRFLFMMVLGFYIYDHMNLFSKNIIWLLSLSVISIIYLIVYGNNGFPYFRSGMNSFQNLLASFYTATCVLTLLNILPKKEKNITSKFLAKCGRLSWQIFLVQIIYFPLIRQLVDYPNVFKGHSIFFQILLLFIYLSLNVVFCFFMGFAFQYFENKYLRIW